MPTATLFLTPGTTSWTVPANFLSLIKVELIGAGGDGASGVVVGNTNGSSIPCGGGGGSGAAYAANTTISATLTVGDSIPVQIGASGSGIDTIFDSGAILAKAGVTANGLTGATAWPASNSFGELVFQGGNGGDSQSPAGGGGGGSAGPFGNGASGGDGISFGGYNGGGGGGGADGGFAGGASTSASAGGVGGNGRTNSGGGAAGQFTPAISVTNGTVGGGGGGGGYISHGGIGGIDPIWDSAHGPGGGGGGTGGDQGNNNGSQIYGGLGGGYGGGGGGAGGVGNHGTAGLGGFGANGVIAITYNTQPISRVEEMANTTSANMLALVLVSALDSAAPIGNASLDNSWTTLGANSNTLSSRTVVAGSKIIANSGVQTSATVTFEDSALTRVSVIEILIK